MHFKAILGITAAVELKWLSKSYFFLILPVFLSLKKTLLHHPLSAWGGFKVEEPGRKKFLLM